MAAKHDRVGELEAKPPQPSDRYRVPIIDKIPQNRISPQQLITPIDRAAQEGQIVAVDRIRAEQPGRTNPGKDVEVSDAEHDFRPAVDYGRPGERRFAQREGQRLSR